MSLLSTPKTVGLWPNVLHSRGCVSQGKDKQEAVENIREAITAWLWAEDQKAMSALQPGAIERQIVVAV